MHNVNFPRIITKLYNARLWLSHRSLLFEQLREISREVLTSFASYLQPGIITSRLSLFWCLEAIHRRPAINNNEGINHRCRRHGCRALRVEISVASTLPSHSRDRRIRRNVFAKSKQRLRSPEVMRIIDRPHDGYLDSTWFRIRESYGYLRRGVEISWSDTSYFSLANCTQIGGVTALTHEVTSFWSTSCKKLVLRNGTISRAKAITPSRAICVRKPALNDWSIQTHLLAGRSHGWSL